MRRRTCGGRSGSIPRPGAAASKDAATDLSNLGLLYQYEGKYPAAEKATAQAMAVYEKLLGENNENVATSASNLALIDMKEDKYADAEALYKKAIAIDQKLGLGADVASDLGGLGTLYDSIGKYADAEQAFNQALAENLKALGPQHPIIGLSYFHIAEAYQFEGKLAEAEQTYGKALAIEQKAPSPDQATIALIEQNIGGLYRDEGKYQQAESLMLQALKSRAKALGPNHPDVALMIASLGGLYEYEFRYSDAERASRQALGIDSKALGSGQRRKRLGPWWTNRPSLRIAWPTGPADQLYVERHSASICACSSQAPTSSVAVGSSMPGRTAVSERWKPSVAAAKLFNDCGRNLSHCGRRLKRGRRTVPRPVLEPSRKIWANMTPPKRLQKKALAIFEQVSGPDSIAWLNARWQAWHEPIRAEKRFADVEPLYLRALKIDQAQFKPTIPTFAPSSRIWPRFILSGTSPCKQRPISTTTLET